jgi:hypothetical protein
VQKPARLIVVDRADPLPENPIADMVVGFCDEVVARDRLALELASLDALA